MAKEKIRYLLIGSAVIFISCAILSLIFLDSKGGLKKFSAHVKISEDKKYKVTSVVDGDTFKVKIDKKEITVRMLGINTPETVDPRKPAECYGKEASGATKGLITNKFVRLEINSGRELVDKYGRYLLYVYLDDDITLNEYLVKNGYAKEYTFGKPYSRQKQFKEAQKYAKNNKLGMWQKCTNAQATSK